MIRIHLGKLSDFTILTEVEVEVFFVWDDS